MEFKLQNETIWIDKKSDESEDIFLLRAAFIVEQLNNNNNQTLIELVKLSEIFVNVYIFNNSYDESILKLVQKASNTEYLKYLISVINTNQFTEV
jgi:hypothetical protein